MNPLESDPILRSSFSALAGLSIAHQSTLTIRDGTAYISTHFLRAALPQLAEAGPVTLITHGSDATADDALAAMIPPNITAWFSVNSATAKARPLPIGLRSDSVNCELLATMREVAMMPKGDHKLYLCATWNNPHLPEAVRVERHNLYKRFESVPWATCRGGNGIGDVAFTDYAADLRGHRYALAPRGSGKDSHRAWEAMYAGCIPIIRRCAWSERFAALDPPWLAVWSWSQVTPELLDARYAELAAKLDGWGEKLTATFWTSPIISALKGLDCGVLARRGKLIAEED